MKVLYTLVIGIAVLWPTAAPAEVVLRRVDGQRPAVTEARVTSPATTSLSSLAGKLDVPQTPLFVPRYFVDPSGGDTTLFAARNQGPTGTLLVQYFGLSASDLQKQTAFTLGPREVLTVNVRDVTGLDPLPNGTLQGFITLLHDHPLSGDYFQVDLEEDFATGDRLVGFDDFCRCQEVRFLQGGPIDGGTQITLLIDEPQGGDDLGDPPTATISVFDEAGVLADTIELFTADNVVTLSSSMLTALGAGALDIDFEMTTGVVFADYSAANRFSVGLNGACIDPCP